MTDHEAYLIATIMADAHEGCWGCSRRLIERFLLHFPLLQDAILQAFEDSFRRPYEPPG